MDYSTLHSLWLLQLIGWALFPRLSFIFSSLTLGPFAILGVIVTPRLMAAMYATQYYASTDPIIVTIAWAVACTELLLKIYFTKKLFWI